jgi:NAD(P)H-dependent FMN reductase
MFRLGIVISSVREGRVGLPVAEWCADRARRHARFEVELVDLKDQLDKAADAMFDQLRRWPTALVSLRA